VILDHVLVTTERATAHDARRSDRFHLYEMRGRDRDGMRRGAARKKRRHLESLLRVFHGLPVEPAAFGTRSSHVVRISV